MKNKALILALIGWQVLHGAAEGSGIWARLFGAFSSSVRPAQVSLVDPNTGELDPITKEDILSKVRQTRGDLVAQLRVMAKEMGVPLKEIRHPSLGRLDWFSLTPHEYSDAETKECNTFKIHLMPKLYSIDFIYDVAARLLTNPVLLENVQSSKFQAHNVGQHITQETMKSYSDVPPFVVLYTFSKEKAQNVLNEVYKLFKNVPGSGIRPRFNGKLNDLIWFAQGNANTKYPESDPNYYNPENEKISYEEPYRIYCSPDFPVSGTNHHLVHPETGEDLVSIE